MWPELLIGLRNTMALFAIGWCFGGLAGAALGVAAFSNQSVRPVVVLSQIILGAVPMLAVLFWVHYPLQTMLGVVWPPFSTASVVLSLFIMGGVAAAVMESLRQVDVRFAEVRLVLGISTREYLARVLIPNATVLMSPRLLILIVNSIHVTMFASLIGVEELFRVIQRLNAEYLRPVELFTLMAVLYAVLCVPLFVAGIVLDRKVSSRVQDA